MLLTLICEGRMMGSSGQLGKIMQIVVQRVFFHVISCSIRILCFIWSKGGLKVRKLSVFAGYFCLFPVSTELLLSFLPLRALFAVNFLYKDFLASYSALSYAQAYLFLLTISELLTSRLFPSGFRRNAC